MFRGALLLQRGGTTGGWSGRGSLRPHPQGWLRSDEGQHLIGLVRGGESREVGGWRKRGSGRGKRREGEGGGRREWREVRWRWREEGEGRREAERGARRGGKGGRWCY